ncbi:RagB/SusD family nutrient uptake outer membrane protein [Maribellus sp. CM-23]|uniref:RagB/SusD family nutrient uptake outer membrane protein n=1 Tax=Maribellus sp. CM-23 TaxID=2781026 RepID=UPI001F44E59F|nr:RagB/SusD family nutrient uptake outer membrane protein [Maribellus sp. CM-23]MCE4563432.1 RagB/SusD family nutrient uptake outer membrane protein [Maribellus sp. CM-23]
MKIIKYKSRMFLLLFIPMILWTTGCSDEWLEPKPLSFFAPENALIDAKGMYAALTACERNMRYEWYGDGSPIITELLFSEVCVEGTTDKPGPAQNMNIQITPTSQLNNTNYNRIGWFWYEGFKGIKYANVVIERIDDATYKDEAERNAVLGSAYFHRAYRYYRLTQQFGDIPFIGREIKEPKLDFYSTKREVILRKIQKDMEFAAQHCSDNVDRGRVTKGAAGHLLTKINLALGDFDKAIASATAVINGGTYSLMRDPFGQVPKEDGDFLTSQGIIRDDVIARLHWWQNKALGANKEVLFMVLSKEDFVDSRLDLQVMRQAVPFWGVSNSNMLYTPDGFAPGTSDLANREIRLVETFGRGIGRARGTSYHTKKIWDDPNDLRHKKGNWMDMEDLVYNHPNLKGKSEYYGKPLELYRENGQVATTDTIRNWFGWPHYKIYNPDPRRTQPQGGSYDWYVFRLAETYLLRAEAYWWKGDIPNAMADVNEVRTRAGAAPYTDASTFDIGTILDERARELFWEEPRKTELNRIAFLFAQEGKAYRGKTYSIQDFGENNFYYDRVMEYTDFYNKGVRANNGQEYTMSPYHVLWPVPQAAISSNTQGQINQNYGYDGYENNVPTLDVISPEDDL